jgi:hypothetical protein
MAKTNNIFAVVIALPVFPTPKKFSPDLNQQRTEIILFQSSILFTEVSHSDSENAA